MIPVLAFATLAVTVQPALLVQTDFISIQESVSHVSRNAQPAFHLLTVLHALPLIFSKVLLTAVLRVQAGAVNVTQRQAA